ncbi:uncharacterized protein LOC131237843 isoform X1 [Magnolia sinica]|uniref:uncharacterized protein LOC131237843 isoform X1 n=1 Tax=Magnolia sinica TaxID=86752 RepID=UPI00265A8A4C|nr:uncharacterized protein LOC131237843 isoform X1 [Magnolia sinica]
MNLPPSAFILSATNQGCGDELSKLFGSYGEIEECKPMDGEDSEPYTDVYWIKFVQVSNARFAKRKLDEFVFLGNQLQVSYAPQYESLSDTKEKLEGRKKEVLSRLNSGRSKGSEPSKQMDHTESAKAHHRQDPIFSRVTSDKEYFSSPSMNNTVQFVREKLDKIKSSSEHIEGGPAFKKPRVDNRRRI